MEAHDTTAGKVWTQAKEMLDTVCAYLESPEALAMSHSQLESVVDTRGREVLRLLVQGNITLRARLEACEPIVPVTDSQGDEHTHVRQHRRMLETLFGAVEVVRRGHGGREMKSLHPLDARLNLPPELYSHGLRRRVAFSAALASFDAVQATLKLTTGAHVPKRQLEQLVRRAARDFLGFYEAKAETADKAGEILVLSLDGKGVVMRMEDLLPATQKKARAKKPKRAKRTSPGEKRNAKRMATVAAVYTIAPHIRTPEEVATPPKKEDRKPAPRPVGKRVWASLERPMKVVIEEMFEEALRQDPAGAKMWVCLTDGNPTQIRLMKKHAKVIGAKMTLVVDIIHVLEYLWKCAPAFHKDTSTAEAEAWVTERLLRILKGESSLVAGGLRRSATLRGLSEKARAPVDRCANYLLKLRDYLQYDLCLGAGYPIGTGVIEGACRHLIKDRMDVTGARWTLVGAEAVLMLRALVSSGDFDAYWDYHEAREFERHHAAVIPFLRRDQPGTEVPCAIAV